MRQRVLMSFRDFHRDGEKGIQNNLWEEEDDVKKFGFLKTKERRQVMKGSQDESQVNNRDKLSKQTWPRFTETSSGYYSLNFF